MQQWLFTSSSTMNIQTIACSRISKLSFPEACPAAISARGLRARKAPIPPTTAQGKRRVCTARTCQRHRDWTFQSKTIRPRLDYAPCLECQTTVASQTSLGFWVFWWVVESLWILHTWLTVRPTCFQFQLRLNEGMCSDWEKVNADPGAIVMGLGCLMLWRYL